MNNENEIVSLLLKLNALHNGKLIETDIRDYTKKILEKASIICQLYSGKLAGFIAYYNNDYKTKVAYLTMIAVNPEEQGQGIGKNLLECAIRDITRKGFKFFRLEVIEKNSKAIELYRALGFVKVDKSSEGKIYMQKRL